MYLGTAHRALVSRRGGSMHLDGGGGSGRTSSSRPAAGSRQPAAALVRRPTPAHAHPSRLKAAICFRDSKGTWWGARSPGAGIKRRAVGRAHTARALKLAAVPGHCRRCQWPPQLPLPVRSRVKPRLRRPRGRQPPPLRRQPPYAPKLPTERPTEGWGFAAARPKPDRALELARASLAARVPFCTDNFGRNVLVWARGKTTHPPPRNCNG